MTEQSEDLVDEVEIIEESTEVVETEEVKEVETNEEEPKQSRSQNAKQRLRRKLREESDARAELEERNKALEKKFTTLESKLDGVINPPAARPSRVDFETEEDYEDALFDWRAPKSEVAPNQPEPVSTTEPKNDADIVSKEVRESWDKQMDTGYEKYDDFEEVIYNKQLTMTDNMTFAVMESEVGGDIAYYLGKNPQKADEISRLSPTAQIRAIDKIAGKFAQNTTNAPSPIDPIGGKGDVDTESVDPLLNGATFT